jgi:hypothetical protein
MSMAMMPVGTSIVAQELTAAMSIEPKPTGLTASSIPRRNSGSWAAGITGGVAP